MASKKPLELDFTNLKSYPDAETEAIIKLSLTKKELSDAISKGEIHIITFLSDVNIIKIKNHLRG
jgi:hypothetical protein